MKCDYHFFFVVLGHYDIDVSNSSSENPQLYDDISKDAHQRGFGEAAARGSGKYFFKKCCGGFRFIFWLIWILFYRILPDL